MKFYLYYAFGYCNDGSCTRGFEEFDTLQEAERRMQQLFDINYDGDCQIIHGVSVESRHK